MPDLDQLPRGLHPAWRDVSNALRGQQPPPVVGDAIDKALARTLRGAGGLQWVVGLSEIVCDCQAQRSLRPLEALDAKLDRGKTTGIGGAFMDVAWSLAAVPEGFPNADPALKALVEAGLERMVDKLCVGPLEPDLVPAVFSSPSDLSRYVRECLDEVQFDNRAAQLVRAGCTGKVRAPRARLSRPGTKGLLHEPIR